MYVYSDAVVVVSVSVKYIWVADPLTFQPLNQHVCIPQNVCEVISTE